MKRPRKRYGKLRSRNAHRQRKRDLHRAQLRRATRRHTEQFRRKHSVYFHDQDARQELVHALYRKLNYSDPPVEIQVTGELGLEDEAEAKLFLETASKFIDFEATELVLNLRSCSRIWPSAIALLCSLAQWVRLTSKPTHHPTIKSTSSQSDAVNSYLAQSGFYAYVGRTDDSKSKPYSEEEVVKIQRETSGSQFNARDRQIQTLLTRFSTLDPEQIELFMNKVATETLLNITEHGINYRYKGWWMIGQFHEKHSIISLCLADNGIGIRNSLAWGPQKGDISISDKKENDGKFIELALTETISGASSAVPKKGPPWKRTYTSGARRGNGLKRIRETCADLRIPFKILSHNGYLFVDGHGDIVHVGAMPNRVFAGTMYHYIIPAQRHRKQQ